MEIVDQQESWSKCISGGLTGWMKNEFIGGLSDRPPDPLRSGKDDEDLPIATEPVVSEDPGQFGDVILNGENDLPDPDEVLDLLGNVYEALKDLCERILAVVGRG